MGPAQERLKVHRRSVRLDGRAHTVLSPRPNVPSRFATNRDGATCQILTDPVGAQLLARLCWAMAYQRHERTVTVIDSHFLVPNPVRADESSPIVIVNSALGSLSGAALADLHSQLPLATTLGRDRGAPDSGTRSGARRPGGIRPARRPGGPTKRKSPGAMDRRRQRPLGADRATVRPAGLGSGIVASRRAGSRAKRDPSVGELGRPSRTIDRPAQSPDPWGATHGALIPTLS